MAEIRKGSIVKARAGRDKEGFFVVLEVLKGEILIVNGKNRPLERPKLKNLRHVAATNTVLEETSMETNRKIRKALAEYIGAER